MTIFLIFLLLILSLTVGGRSNDSGYRELYEKRKKKLMGELTLTEKDYKTICKAAAMNEKECVISDGRTILITAV